MLHLKFLFLYPKYIEILIFRIRYGVQFFLDILKTYFSGTETTADSSHMNEEDLRNLRNSFFGLIKYYTQKEVKISELNALVSFLSASRHLPQLQHDLCDVLLSLVEAPNATDQLFLLLYEPHLADSFYALICQVQYTAIHLNFPILSTVYPRYNG